MSTLCQKQGYTHRLCPIPQPLGSEQARDACWGKPCHALAEHGGPPPPGTQPEWCGGAEPAGSGQSCLFISRNVAEFVPKVPLGLQPIIAFFLGACILYQRRKLFNRMEKCVFFLSQGAGVSKGVTHLHRSFTGGRWIPPPSHIPGGWETGLLALTRTGRSWALDPAMAVDNYPFNFNRPGESLPH